MGYAISGTKYLLLETEAIEEIPDVPAIRVLYWYDTDRVYLVSCMLVSDTIHRER
jgi:hypothetical protein